VVDCQSQEAGLAGLSEMSVAEFFHEYMQGTERKDKTIKKLKDWPAYTEFLEKFPDLYADFHQAMPVPDYTRRDGVWNISAHVSRLCLAMGKRLARELTSSSWSQFPSDRGIPDIGPKMYNAFVSGPPGIVVSHR